MWGFLTGAIAAAVLATATFFVLEYAATSSIERVDDRSVIIEDHVGSVAGAEAEAE